MTAEGLYKKDEDITGEGYIYKHTFELDGIRNNLGCNGVKLVLSQDNALKAVEMAREEEREKAIKALDIAIMAIFERNTHSVSMGELRAQFNKLLNE